MIILHDTQQQTFVTNAENLYEACRIACEETGRDLDRMISLNGRFLNEWLVVGIYDEGIEAAEYFLFLRSLQQAA